MHKRFDHIYAFEITPKTPMSVFEKVPDEFMASYHWMNIGVSAEKDSRFNPLTTILKNFDKDDFVVVKLDIDTPSVEMPLVQQLLGDRELQDLVDAFYFEHHVNIKEMAEYWGLDTEGTLQSSLKICHDLRQKGVPAHSWV